MSTSSRFHRTRASDTDQSPVTPSAQQRPASEQRPAAPARSLPQANPHTHSTSSIQDLNVLQERLTRVQRERVQREVELKATEKTIQECEAAARKLGINSLEEMEEYVQRLEQEDIAAQETFEQQLEAEETLLHKITQQLSDLERE